MGNCTQCGKSGHYFPTCPKRKRRASEASASEAGTSSSPQTAPNEVIVLEGDTPSHEAIHAAGQPVIARAMDVPGTSSGAAPTPDEKNMSIEEYAAHRHKLSRLGGQMDFICVICQNTPLVSPLFANCNHGHVTCSDCHYRLRKTDRPMCPLCRREFPPNSIRMTSLEQVYHSFWGHTVPCVECKNMIPCAEFTEHAALCGMNKCLCLDTCTFRWREWGEFVAHCDNRHNSLQYNSTLHKGRLPDVSHLIRNSSPSYFFDVFGRPISREHSLFDAFYQENIHGETLEWTFTHFFSSGGASDERSMWVFKIRRNVTNGGGRSSGTRGSARVVPTFQVCALSDLGGEGTDDPGAYGCIYIHGNLGENKSISEYSETTYMQHMSRIPCSHFKDPAWYDFTLFGRLLDHAGSSSESSSYHICFTRYSQT
jgi:hypothetical protein